MRRAVLFNRRSGGILKLHPKTILRFIHEGKIRAQKIGRSWRISREALKEYSHAELAVPARAVEPVDFGTIGSRMRVSSVIEIDEQNSEEASRLSNTLMAALNCKDPSWGNSRFDWFYYPETRKANMFCMGLRPSSARSCLCSPDWRAAREKRHEPGCLQIRRGANADRGGI
jgi:excisionase family DNA binding protein